MTNRNTRRAFLASLMALILCVSSLLGTTYAWFTDEVTSANNKIVAGNLDVELEYYDGSKWVAFDSETNVFKEGALWEPGHTEVVYLKVSNLGSLALKYNLGVNIASETAGINAAGDVFFLSDYIEFGAIETATENFFADRDAARKAVTDAKIISKGYAKSSKLVNKGDAEYVALVVYMPETVGNEANFKNGTNAPVINLGIKVFATQLSSENDTFGTDYDELAPWIGEVDTTWYDASKNEFTLTNAGQLAGLAELVNGGNTFAGKTVKLGADIDLNNVNWTPIGTKSAEGEKAFTRTFAGSFDGQGHTISNLRVVGGNALGLFGRTGTGTHIEDLNIVNAYVSGTDYVGAIAGYAYLSANCIKNCTVENATIIATPFKLANGEYDGGAKAGAIVGYALNGNVIGNTVKKSTVTAYRDLGGIVGMLNADGIKDRTLEASGNTVDEVTLSYIGVPGVYTEGKVNQNMNDIVGRVGSKSSVGENTVTNVTKNEANKGAIMIFTLEELIAFAKDVNAGNTYAGKTVILGDHIDLLNMEWTPIGTGAGFKGTFDGNGKTVSNLKITGNKSTVGFFANTYDGEIKNLTIENAAVSGDLYVGVVAGNPYTSKYTNITVKGHVEVNGFSYVGGVGGKNAYANWTDVKVDVDATSYVKAVSTEYDPDSEYADENGNVAYRTYVGGVVGFNGEGGHTFKNITSNIAVIGDVCDIGGVFGIAHYGNNFENVTCSGTVTNTNTNAEDVLETGGIAGVWNNATGYTVTFTDCEFTGTLIHNTTADLSGNKIVGTKYSATGTGKLIIVNYVVEDGITYAIDGVAGGKTLTKLPANAPETLVIPEGVTGLGNKILNGNTTVKEVVIPSTMTNFGGTPNATGTGASGGFFYQSAVEKVTLPDGITEIPAAAFNQASNLKEVNIPSSVKKIGINAFAGTGLTELTVPATVEEIGYGAFRDMLNLTKVTIDGDVYVPDYAFRNCASLEEVYLNGLNVTFGTNMIFTVTSTNNENPNGITVHVKNAAIKERLEATNQFKGTIVCEEPANENGIYTDGATKYAYAADATSFSTALTNGADKVYLSSGNYVIPAAAKGKTLTIVGSGDTSVAVTKVGAGGENCDYGLDGSNVTFENVTITTNSSTYIGYARCNATYNNCTFNGTYTLYGDSEFNNCTFNVSGDVYNIWTWGAPTATFNNCTFNSDGKAILLYGTVNTKLTVNECTFNDKGGLSDKKAAIEIGNDYGKSYELIVNKTTVNGYEENDKGIPTGSTLWGNKNSMGSDKLNVVLDGVDIY